MDRNTLLLLLGTLLLLGAGQVLFRYAAVGLDIKQPTTFISWPLIIALAVYGIATIAWMLVLSRVPLSVAFPFYGLTFLIVPIFARVFLNEPLEPKVFVGGLIIMLGVIVSAKGIPTQWLK